MLKFPAIKKSLLKLEFLLDIALITSVFCLIFSLAHRAIFDLDIWLHLKTGQFIAQNKIVPFADLFSFTMPQKPWVDHSWLFQLASYLVHSAWGPEGLISLECLVIILSFAVLFLIGFSLVRSYLEVAIFIMLAAYASISRFNIRPDIFSLFFFALYLYFLRLHIDKRRIFCLVPIQVLWVNLHGYFFLGPLLVFFFILAEFLRRRLKFLPRGWQEGFALSDRTNRRLAQLFIFVVLACFLNPRLFQGALYPFYILKDVLMGRVQVFMRYIQELKPTLSLNLGSSYYTIMYFCFALIAINFKRLKIIEIILVVFFFLFSLSLRNIGFFVFICYMVTVSYLGEALKKVAE
ncbi:MAG: hypothetical protein NT066_05005, partial [Candidatus Omnitrophica bacterium]|nr:hypothetical protein [Candidatus Omnitrophota bacterium]